MSENMDDIIKKVPNHINFWDELQTGGEQPSSDRLAKLPVGITGALTFEQMSAYEAYYRIEEITELLKRDVLPLPKFFTRMPTANPVYDAEGKRTNTEDETYRKHLEDERYRLVEVVLKIIPYYTPPKDYVRPTKFQEKYYIPVDQYTGVNFVGLLLGPRGNTLKKLQEESKCKIAIRGRGSVKEGKHSSDLPKGAANMEDPLHCLIIADSEDKIQDGIRACQSVIIRAVTSPEGQNDLKRGQLRELAELNGTLRDDTRPCSICGLKGHMKHECPNRTSFAQQVICHNCGQAGHVTRDCPTTQNRFTPSNHNNLYNNNYQGNGNSQGRPIQNSRYGNSVQGVNNNYSRTPPPTQNRYNNTNSNSRFSRYGDGNNNNNNNNNNSNSNNNVFQSRQSSRSMYDGQMNASTTTAGSVNDSTFTGNSSSGGIAQQLNAPPGFESGAVIPGVDSITQPLGLEAPMAPPGLDTQMGPPPEAPSMNGPPGLDYQANDMSLPPGLDYQANDMSLPPGILSPPSATHKNTLPNQEGPPGL